MTTTLMATESVMLGDDAVSNWIVKQQLYPRHRQYDTEPYQKTDRLKP